MSEERKAAIRRRQLERQYPRRKKAEFTAENDHNPFVLNDCPRCHGTGNEDSYASPGMYSLDTCTECQGAGTTYQVERYYPTESDLIDVCPNPFGWIECPRCHRRFLAGDGHAWTGLRHRGCGQKLRIIT